MVVVGSVVFVVVVVEMVVVVGKTMAVVEKEMVVGETLLGRTSYLDAMESHYIDCHIQL